MAHTLEQFAASCHQILKADPGPAGRTRVCGVVEEVLQDEAFLARHLGDDVPDRKILYEDPELGFCVCGHVYEKGANGAPHDHGPTWAIYGVAAGDTDMTDWRIVKKGGGEQPSLVEPVTTYNMQPGDAHFYDVGAVHSPRRDGMTKLIRIEGKNLDLIKRSNIKAA